MIDSTGAQGGNLGAAQHGEDEQSESREFEAALAAGQAAMQAGDVAGAVARLEQAAALRPRDQRARNLLGLAFFKQGELESADAIFRGLIDDQPSDPTLRVNLGLVFLKAGASGDAARSFETALELQPDHAKAQNYLGIALAQKGDHARAREWFLRCGNAGMAERMAVLIQSSQIRQVAAEAEGALAAGQPFRAVVEEAAAPAPSAAESSRWIATGPATRETAPGVTKVAEKVRSDPGGAPQTFASASFVGEPQLTPTPPILESVPPPVAPEPLATFTSQRRLEVPTGKGGFAIRDTDVIVHVQGGMLTRLDGLIASFGGAQLVPELKSFRGKPTDKPFGEGPRRMLRATGNGRYVIAREGRRFTALELGDEPAYFREETLFAIETSLSFENGRVPSKLGADLHLVHLRGRGNVLLVTRGAPRAIDVQRGEPLRIPMEQLIGWHGPLIQPRLVPMVDAAPELGIALELAGEGRALVDALDAP